MLTDRQMLILQAIIDHYTQHDEPIGSKTLAQRASIDASSATIRNEMAKLEHMNLIGKTHSSSGRVPMEAGYRYYINYIMPKFGGLIDYGLSDREQEMLHEIFRNPYAEIDEIVAKSAETLAILSQNVVIALGPASLTQKLAGFKIVPLSDEKGMAILVTDVGAVETQVFTLANTMSWQMLDDLVDIMNDQLIGLALPSVLQRLQTDYMVFYKHDTDSLVDHLVNKIDGDRLIVSGRQILYQHLSEADDIEQINAVNAILDDHDLIIDLINELDQGIQVRVGGELAHPQLKNMSLMTSSLGRHSQANDLVFALLGPENMPYLKMAQLIHGVRRELNAYLDKNQKI